jgi:hypothetical protein
VHLVSIEDIFNISADIEHSHDCLYFENRAGMTGGRKKSKSRVALKNEEELTMHILAFGNRRPVL